jgi:tRNA_anti-like
MAQCPSCQAKFVTAKVCPACGAKQPMSVEKKVGIGIAVVLVAVVGIAMGSGPSSAPPNAAPAAQATAPKQAPIQVLATTLFEAYAANEVSADDKYRGRVLIVDGTVESIDKDFRDDIVVRLAGDRFSTVDAYLMDDDKPLAAGLTKGQSLRIFCVGFGRSVGSPILKACRIDPNPL